MEFTWVSRWRPQALALLRIFAALLFMEHGLAKLFHFPVPQPGVPSPLPSLLLTAAIIEVVGGTLVTLGLFTRLAAFVMSGEIAIGYFMAHAPKSFWPVVSGGVPAVLYCFLWLWFSAAGAGPWSLDALLARRSRPA